MSAVADESLTNQPVASVLVAYSPVNMAGPLSSRRNMLQEELDHFNNLAGQELRKGPLRNKELLAQY